MNTLKKGVQLTLDLILNQEERLSISKERGKNNV